MKKLEKLFEKRTLTAESGKLGSYNYKRMVISANEEKGGHIFTIKRYEGSGYTSNQTIILEDVLAEMRAFAPRASAWKVSRKPKAVKQPKVKAEKEVAPVVAIKKGRG